MPAHLNVALALALAAVAEAAAISRGPDEAPPAARRTEVAPPPARADAAPSPALAWAPQETMEFTVEYLGLKAGHARIVVGEIAGAVMPVFLEARTAGVGAIVTFRQQLATYLDLATGLPRSSSMLSVEPHYRLEVTTRFDRDAGKATVRAKGRNDRTHEVAVPADALDFVALVFRLRALPLEPGSRHEFSVLSETKLSKVVASVERREVIETRSGKVPALKVRVPTGFTGKFSEKNPTYVWLSDDARRVVLRISTDFAIGRAVAHLVSYRAGGAPEQAVRP